LARLELEGFAVMLLRGIQASESRIPNPVFVFGSIDSEKPAERSDIRALLASGFWLLAHPFSCHSRTNTLPGETQRPGRCNWIFTCSKLFVFLIIGFFCGSVHAAGPAKPMIDPIVVFEKGHLQTVGVSPEGLPRYRALRNAQSLARKKMENALKRLRISGNTAIEKGMKESVEFSVDMQTFFDSMSKCGQVYHEENAFAEVCMQVKTKGEGGLYDFLLHLLQDNDSYLADLTDKKKPIEQNASVEETTDAEEPNRSQEAILCDGLIVDTRGCSFSPALINRVLAESGDIVFSPDGIQADVLVNRGFFGFATNQVKARALLEGWGGIAPLRISCTGVQNYTDALISQNDAALIRKHDDNSSFLSQAKVVFIINRKN
jgi:hypothetical protein